VSLREKDLAPSEQVALAKRFRDIAGRYGASLLLHGDPALAHEAGLAGVHLSAGFDASAARALLGADALIGMSVHGVAEVESLNPGVVNYAIAGPFAETMSKPGYGPALGEKNLAALVSASPVPLLAIGGVTSANLAEARAAGAAGAAVMGEVMRAADPAAVVAALIRKLA